MRLSNYVGDYTNAGGLTDRYQVVATGGETRFALTFIDGAEELYLNGARLFKGSSQDYVTDTSPDGSHVVLNSPLIEGDELLLIGRSAVNEIPFTRAVSETVVITDGQLQVNFTSIEADGIEIYVQGPLVDRGRLQAPQDYTVTGASEITLTHSFPNGTVIEGVQSARLAWVDPDNMVVNDGEQSKSLSARFRDTEETDPHFIQANGTNLQELVVGMRITKWIVGYDGIPAESIDGNYPVLRLGKSYWWPNVTGPSSAFIVSSWTITGTVLTINVLDETTNVPRELMYHQNRAVGTENGGSEVDYGLITEAVYDQYDDGGL